MAQIKSQLASKVLRDVQIPEDSSVGGLSALSDANAYLDEGAYDVFSRRIWPEFLILGTMAVSASTPTIPFSSIIATAPFDVSGNGRSAVFSTITGVRDGSNPLFAVDPTALNALNPDLWANATSPIGFWPRGTSGIYLTGGGLSSAKTLSFIGKASYQALTASESWVMDPEGKALIAYAAAKIVRSHDRDDQRAAQFMQDFENEIQKLIDKAEVQTATDRKVVPTMPWTADQWAIANTSISGSFSGML